MADTATSISATQNINVWFQVTMDVEFWKNCGFQSCPNPGSYFCQTACDSSGFPNPAAFLSLTGPKSSICGQSVTAKAVNANGTFRQTTSVQDCGPQAGGGCTNPYWNSGNIPALGGCLSDVLAANLGIANGCLNGQPFGGPATVYWRFGN